MLNGGLDGPFRHHRAKRTGIVSAVSTLASPLPLSNNLRFGRPNAVWD